MSPLCKSDNKIDEYLNNYSKSNPHVVGRKKHSTVASCRIQLQKHSQQTQRQIYKIHQTLLCPHFCAQSGHI